MSLSDTPSDWRPRRFRRWLGSGLTLLSLALSAGDAGAASLLSLDEALRLAFPGCSTERRTVFLTEAQLERARAVGGAAESRLVHPYVATCAGKPGGVAFFDTHRVRTKDETLMVALDAGGKVLRLEIVAFAEPPEYIPRDIWYDQFPGRSLDGELQVGRAIRPVTGATLTARATTEAVRRVMAVAQVLREDGAL